MTSDPTFPDQDAEPPTPDGEEPDVTGIETDDPEPGSHPDEMSEESFPGSDPPSTWAGPGR